MGQDETGNTKLLAHRAMGGSRGAFGYERDEQSAAHQGNAGQPEEQPLPGHDRERPLDGQGGRHRAGTSCHHVEAGDEGPTARREPEGEFLDRRHQPAGKAQADQEAR